MFLFILESIGMQELVLIGAVALIVFGPRKLPGMARTAGKMMQEFRKATSDFKETWEKEVQFEEFRVDDEEAPATIAKGALDTSVASTAPEIREIRQEDLAKHFPLQAAESPAGTSEESADNADVASDEPAAPVAAKVPSGKQGGKQEWL